MLTGSCKWKPCLISRDHQSRRHQFSPSFITNISLFLSYTAVWFWKGKKNILFVETQRISKLCISAFVTALCALCPLGSMVGGGGCLHNNHAGVDGVDGVDGFCVNTANSILKCACSSHKPRRVPPFYLLITLSLLICHGKRCGGGRAAWMPRQTDAVAICSATSSDPTTQARRTLIY